MGLSRTWCQSGEFVLECDNYISVIAGHEAMPTYNIRSSIS